MNVNRLRSKWAAVGAAVAVTLGAGGIGITHATTSSGEMPIYIPIEPCRLADTRTDFQVGSRGTPLGADETYTLDGQGSVGNCNLPNGTTALSLNVTALDASAPTFVSLFPAGASLPVASHLNPLPGQGPTPNAVNVDLNGGGEFSIYNLAGTVNVIIDVVGVFDDHEHTGADIVDESLTGADIDDGTVGSVDTSNEAGIAFSNQPNEVEITTTASVASSVSIRPPSSGYVNVSATAFWYSNTVGRQLRCQITDGTTTIDGSKTILLDTDPEAGSLAHQVSIEQTFAVDAYAGPVLFGQPFNLVCNSSTGTLNMNDIHMTATFFPTSYAPFGIIIPLGAPDAGGLAD